MTLDTLTDVERRLVEAIRRQRSMTLVEIKNFGSE
jgi:hypothetical protein